MAYNSYVVIDEKIAVFDTVDARFGGEWMANLKSALNGRTPDYLIVQHMEPDHSANIASFIKNYPNAKIGIIVSNGMTSTNYINAEIEIAKRYGVAYINETTDNNIPLLIRTMRTDVLTSVKNARNNNWEVLPGTNNHPNAKCHEYESTIIEDFMRRI